MHKHQQEAEVNPHGLGIVHCGDNCPWNSVRSNGSKDGALTSVTLPQTISTTPDTYKHVKDNLQHAASAWPCSARRTAPRSTQGNCPAADGSSSAAAQIHKTPQKRASTFAVQTPEQRNAATQPKTRPACYKALKTRTAAPCSNLPPHAHTRQNRTPTWVPYRRQRNI